MLISYVVRLRSDALTDGRFVGEIEAVTSRQRRSIRNIDQLAAFVLSTMAVQVASKETAREIVLEVDPAIERERCSDTDGACFDGARALSEHPALGGERR
jgi:hypothetical protein